MCGLTGYYDTSAQHFHDAILSMNAAISHRGPDDTGVWRSEADGIVFGHQRLSIIDISKAGHQPMPSGTGRYVMVYNGEIYNHLQIRQQLGDTTNFKGNSDTETILAAFDAWGVEDTLQKLKGMFAIALFDKQTGDLILMRDRLGEKPLYYGWQGQGTDAIFLFGSELKALKAHPKFEGDINRNAITLLLRHNAIPAPHSIYKGICKLPAGHILRLTKQDRQSQTIQSPQPYWQLSEIATRGASQTWKGTAQEAIDALEAKLLKSVKAQMLSDVPLGAFLSGGIDSSTIVALMQAQSQSPIKTFTIGFDDKEYDEAQHAKAIAKHLGTAHTDYYVSPEEAMNVIPQLPTIYDEPFSDSSQIPTFLVSRLAREKVAVSLSGDGGDELFCGYNRYKMLSVWQKAQRLPDPLRKMASAILSAGTNDITARAAQFIPYLKGQTDFQSKIKKASYLFKAQSADDLYQHFVSHWHHPASIVIGAEEPATYLTANRPDLSSLSDVETMMVLDMLTYMPDDILVKLDRAAMSVSLESRVPFLDHELVEFAWHLPQDLKLRDGQTKWILRQILHKYVPQSLMDRPKKGFAVPIDSWLRGPLRDWAEALLDETLLKQQGYFDPAPIREKWDAHLSGKQNWQFDLWDILMFQSWLEANQP